jgi:transcriptional regulator with XRE-family HTH domain
MEASFGMRLRQHRERQHIELAAIADYTKIQRSLLEGLERDDLSRWPAGIFRKAWVRAYAQAIGLNADAVVRELCELYPEEPESVEAIASALDRSVTSRFARTLNLTSWLRDVVSSAATRPANAPRPGPAPRRDIASMLEEASQALGAVGVVLWSWDPLSAVLRPLCGHGYAQAVLSAFPDVPSNAENAVGAAFRRAEMCVVEGGDDITGALAIPLMALGGCVGVLALEFRSGVELRESVRAAATRLAADLVSLLAPALQQSSVA